VPWLRADIEAEAYALEAHVIDVLHHGELDYGSADVALFQAAEALGGWLYLLGPSPRHAARLAAHYACPAADLRPWLGLVERAARAACPGVTP